MANFLTTRQLQDLLQVDRTTIYRMAESGRIPALKVGSQWRFPHQQVESWLRTQHIAVDGHAEQTMAELSMDLDRLLPVECVQQIQDAFADALGVMIVVADLEGRHVTRPSHACGLYAVAAASPLAQRRCQEMWARLGRMPSLRPTFVESHLGLLCARGLIRVGSELKAMVVAGGIAPPGWPPQEAQIQQIAANLELSPVLIRSHIHEVFDVGPADMPKLLAFVQRIADIIAHILTERSQLFTKLHDIAELTKF